MSARLSELIERMGESQRWAPWASALRWRVFYGRTLPDVRR